MAPVGTKIDSLPKSGTVVVFFYMDGCPYCAKMEGVWKGLKEEKEGEMEFAIMESVDAQKNGIQGGYPQFKVYVDGKLQARRVDGSMDKQNKEWTPETFKAALVSGSGGKRRRSRSHKSVGRRGRKTIHHRSSGRILLR